MDIEYVRNYLHIMKLNMTFSQILTLRGSLRNSVSKIQKFDLIDLYSQLIQDINEVFPAEKELLLTVKRTMN